MTFEQLTCDSCGPAVLAAYLIKLVDGELSFCGHHYNKNKEALDKLAFEIIQCNKQEEAPQLVETE